MLAPDPAPASNGISWPELCRSECIARLLQRRDFKCTDDVLSFLNPRLAALADPFLISGIHDAVERYFHVIDDGHRIVVFGEYDVDGVTCLALVSEAQLPLGIERARL